jgi:hypothetical protein
MREMSSQVAAHRNERQDYANHLEGAEQGQN